MLYVVTLWILHMRRNFKLGAYDYLINILTKYISHDSLLVCYMSEWHPKVFISFKLPL